MHIKTISLDLEQGVIMMVVSLATAGMLKKKRDLSPLLWRRK